MKAIRFVALVAATAATLVSSPSAPAQLSSAGVLADPRLDLLRGPTVIASNDDWKTSPDLPTLLNQAFTAGLQNSERAVLLTLEPGVYTAS